MSYYYYCFFKEFFCNLSRFTKYSSTFLLDDISFNNVKFFFYQYIFFINSTIIGKK